MRQPPSPLLLSARKRRPRRTPPRGAHGLLGDSEPAAENGHETAAAVSSPEGERCALVQPFPDSTENSADDAGDEPELQDPSRTAR
jgi:hypothetical protein